ncbi:DoxX family membrane protein [Nocardioides daphniae]|uniref:DoxX family membrane protein n=1 Tax=Nocardioides daphniae TaxID=402297 RepID=A0A4P7UBW6_9ACTN|nr:DoxX family membrane protein [Nocardioides daphniae]
MGRPGRPGRPGQGHPAPQDPAVLARAAAAVQIGAAGALALGKAPRLSAALLAASLAPTALAANPLDSSADPRHRQRNIAETAKNASLLGGVLLASVDTEGRPGLAWRARRATRDAKRQAAHLAKEARLEARLAAKSLT